MSLEEMICCSACGKEARAFVADWNECSNCEGHYAGQGNPCCQGCDPCIECNKYVSKGVLCEECYSCPGCCKCKKETSDE